MNVLEASKSGRRFRRPYMAEQPGGGWYSNRVKDFMADDWEVEPIFKIKKTAWILRETGAVMMTEGGIGFKQNTDIADRAPWLDEP